MESGPSGAAVTKVLWRRGRDRRRSSHVAANTNRTAIGTAMLTASTLERLLDELWLGEDEDDIEGPIAIAD